MAEFIKRPFWFWTLGAVFALVLIYLLQGILAPFILGFVFAYLLDPLCDILCAKIKWKHFNRGWVSLFVLIFFFALILVLFAMLIPVVQDQLQSIAQNLPKYMEQLAAYWAPVRGYLGLGEGMQSIDVAGLIGKYFGASADVARGAVAGILQGGGVLFSVLSLIVVTPVVAFYLLRDWDTIIARIDGQLPRKQANTIRALAAEVDATLSGFIRGQGLVCLFLAIFYGAGLSLIGLDFGLTLGIFAGLFSFVPFLGSGLGMILSLIVALGQFSDWLSIGLVAAVFGVGQLLEGNILSPYLVGSRVGLSPLWIIFALMAGGSLLGFAGVLLAVPLAATIGVLVRFGMSQYRQSQYYLGQK